MKYIATTLPLKSIPERGQLLHPLFGEVIVWRQHEFHAWWNIFETMVDHPLSRILINGFVDALEFQNAMPSVNGLFRKKKFNKESEVISAQLGWGTFLLDHQNVVHSAHPLLSVALGQYLLEFYHGARFKIRWIESGPQTVQLQIEPSSQLPHPQPLEPFRWWQKQNFELVESSMTLDLHSEKELRFEGERVVLIPIESLNRFFLGCMPYIPQQDSSWFDGNSSQLDMHEHLLKVVLQSISDMFLNTEQPVYIIDESSWISYIEHYICERGWGIAVVTGYDTATYVLNLTIPMQSQFPYTLGLICGMWERAHGRAFQVSLRQENDSFAVQIQSLLAYENQ